MVAIVFTAALLRTTFGFGDAVIGMPLLTLLPVGLHTDISLLGLCGLTVAALAVATGWRQADRPTLARLLAAAIVGLPVGLALVRFAPASITIAMLAAALFAYAVYGLTRPAGAPGARRRQTDERWAYAFGFLSGALGSAYNFNGTPVAVYGSLRGWSPQRFRGTLQAYFLASGIVIVAGQGIGGLWPRDLGMLYAACLPALVAATLLGVRLARHFPAERFRRAIFVLILALAALMLTRSL